MKSFEGKIVLITGGASGIGKIMAKLLLEKKAIVVIWDIDSPGIKNTVKAFSDIGSITGYEIDITKVADIQENYKRVVEEVGEIDLLINNAGIVVGDYFFEQNIVDISKTLEVNTQAPMIISNLVLKSMVKRNTGHICNIASSGGLVANPKMAVYAASKWAIIGWSDSVRLELKQLKKNILVTTIMPYYINTGMFDGVKSVLPILNPEKTALKIIKAIEKNKAMVTFPGYIYRTIRLCQAILPKPVYHWLIGSFLGIYKTMDDFKGHS